MDALEPHLTLVDGHVHVHEEFTGTGVLEHAWRNFGRAARVLGCARFTPVLALTETFTAHWFDDLAGCAGRSVSGWQVRSLDEPCSLELVRESGDGRMLVLAGRQIVTAEGLEVLALFGAKGAERVKDGLPIRVVVDRVIDDNGIPVIPWGFGKWWGRRGRIVRDLVETAPASGVRFGDNAGRARWLPSPRILRRASQLQVQILSGSDPLPFAGESSKPGRFGFALETECSTRRPAASLRGALAQRHVVVRPFGDLESGGRFVVNQVRMQLRKRLA